MLHRDEPLAPRRRQGHGKPLLPFEYDFRWNLADAAAGPLLDEWEFRGEWWVPASESTKVAGVLSFVPGEPLSLELFGFLGRGDARCIPMLPPTFVHGRTTHGEEVTLVNCFELRRSGRGDKAYSLLNADSALLGSHYPDSSGITFTSADVYVSGLSAWLGNRPIDERFGKFNATYDAPSRVEHEVPAWGASLAFRSHFSHDSTPSSLRWKHRDFIRLTVSDERDYAWFMREVYHIQGLLMFLVGRGLQLTELRLDDAEVLFPQRMPKAPRTLTLADMLFRLPDVEDDFGHVVDQWACSSARFGPVYDLFFEVNASAATSVPMRFLLLTQALEAYDRRRYQGQYVSDQDYKAIRVLMEEAIPHEAPSDLQDALRQRLRFGNEHSLRKRLRRLLSELTPAGRDLVSRGDHLFADMVVATRNHLTHYPATSDPQIEPPSHNVNWRLKALLLLHVLKDLGIADDKTASRMRAIREWQYYLTQCTV